VTERVSVTSQPWLLLASAAVWFIAILIQSVFVRLIGGSAIYAFVLLLVSLWLGAEATRALLFRALDRKVIGAQLLTLLFGASLSTVALMFAAAASQSRAMGAPMHWEQVAALVVSYLTVVVDFHGLPVPWVLVQLVVLAMTSVSVVLAVDRYHGRESLSTV
jgi:hypothetical protein